MASFEARVKGLRTYVWSSEFQASGFGSEFWLAVFVLTIATEGSEANGKSQLPVGLGGLPYTSVSISFPGNLRLGALERSGSASALFIHL